MLKSTWSERNSYTICSNISSTRKSCWGLPANSNVNRMDNRRGFRATRHECAELRGAPVVMSVACRLEGVPGLYFSVGLLFGLQRLIPVLAGMCWRQ